MTDTVDPADLLRSGAIPTHYPFPHVGLDAAWAYEATRAEALAALGRPRRSHEGTWVVTSADGERVGFRVQSSVEIDESDVAHLEYLGLAETEPGAHDLGDGDGGAALPAEEAECGVRLSLPEELRASDGSVELQLLGGSVALLQLQTSRGTVVAPLRRLLALCGANPLDELRFVLRFTPAGGSAPSAVLPCTLASPINCASARATAGRGRAALAAPLWRSVLRLAAAGEAGLEPTPAAAPAPLLLSCLGSALAPGCVEHAPLIVCISDAAKPDGGLTNGGLTLLILLGATGWRPQQAPFALQSGGANPLCARARRDILSGERRIVGRDDVVDDAALALSTGAVLWALDVWSVMLAAGVEPIDSTEGERAEEGGQPVLDVGGAGCGLGTAEGPADADAEHNDASVQAAGRLDECLTAAHSVGATDALRSASLCAACLAHELGALREAADGGADSGRAAEAACDFLRRDAARGGAVPLGACGARASEAMLHALVGSDEGGADGAGGVGGAANAGGDGAGRAMLIERVPGGGAAASRVQPGGGADEEEDDEESTGSRLCERAMEASGVRRRPLDDKLTRHVGLDGLWTAGAWA